MPAWQSATLIPRCLPPHMHVDICMCTHSWPVPSLLAAALSDPRRLLHSTRRCNLSVAGDLWGSGVASSVLLLTAPEDTATGS